MVGMVALDLRKAFDTVDHGILLNKLQHYGVINRENEWFKDYLSDRKQISIINNVLSQSLTINTGVPQGSILGPLLFVIYVNDLLSSISTSSVNMYADDTAFYYGGCDASHICDVLQNDLEQVHDWLNSNKLSLHIGKTNSILICSSRKRASLQSASLSLRLDDELISPVEKTDYLGITIDNELAFKPQFDKTIAKLNRSVGVLRRISPFIPVSTRKTLFNTLVLPHYDYCSTVWCTLPKTYIMRLQRIQNRGMRTILNAHPRSHATDLLNSLNFMSIHQRLVFNRCTLMWKSIHHQAPTHLSELFSSLHSKSTHNTRSSAKLNVFLDRSHPKSFQHTGSRAWKYIVPNLGIHQ
jgi:hypothetical protein